MREKVREGARASTVTNQGFTAVMTKCDKRLMQKNPLGESAEKLLLSQWADQGIPLSVVSLEQEPAQSHTHDFVEIVYVHSGAGTHYHGSRSYPIFAGDVFVVLPGEYHGYGNIRQMRISNLLFSSDLFLPFQQDLLTVPGFMHFFAIEPLFREENSFRYKLHLGAVQQKILAGLIDNLESELDKKMPGFRTLCIGVFLQVIVFVSRCFEDSLRDNQNAMQEFAGKADMVAAAKHYLELNYGEDVRVEDVARSVFISASRLSHVFKGATGMSLFDYLSRVRIDRACEMLAAHERSISDICFLLGYQSPAYFARAFRKHTGMSPLSYRKAQTLRNKIETKI